MTSKRAIEILQKQRAKLDNSKHYNDAVWIAQSADYVKEFIGENSTLHNLIFQFHFGIVNDGSMSREEILLGFRSKVEFAKRYIDDCIEYIQTNGLYKKEKIKWYNDPDYPKRNWLLFESWKWVLTFGLGASLTFSIKECMPSKTTRQQLQKDSLQFHSRNFDTLYKK